LQRRWSFAELAGPSPQVPVLVVLATAARACLGGVQRALCDRLDATTDDWALLTPDGDGWLRLELEVGGRRLARRWRGVSDAGGILATAAALGARTIHLENLAPWDPAVLLPLLAPGNPKLVVGAHDLGAFCVRPHLFDANTRSFCAFSRTAARCGACLSAAKMPHRNLATYRQHAQQLLEGAAVVVTPSRWLAGQLEHEVAPRARFCTVPPATRAEKLVVAPRTGNTRLRRLAWLGNFRDDKGAGLARVALQPLLSRIEVAQFGAIDPAFQVEVRELAHLARGSYQPGTLGRHLVRLGIDLAVVASRVPESHGLVADEAWRAGVGVLSFDRGALGQRLRDHAVGHLVTAHESAAGDAAELAAVLAQLADGTLPLPQPVATDALPTPEGAARSFAEVYREFA
jgi:glycosyltransferase involved in cell wall biosynthesis